MVYIPKIICNSPRKKSPTFRNTKNTLNTSKVSIYKTSNMLKKEIFTKIRFLKKVWFFEKYFYFSKKTKNLQLVLKAPKFYIKKYSKQLEKFQIWSLLTFEEKKNFEKSLIFEKILKTFLIILEEQNSRIVFKSKNTLYKKILETRRSENIQLIGLQIWSKYHFLKKIFNMFLIFRG